MDGDESMEASAVADYLNRERQYVSHSVDALTDAAPFRKTADE